MGDAEFFAERSSESVRYDHRLSRWLLIDERTGRWIPDQGEGVRRIAVDSMRERRELTGAITDDEQRKRAYMWCHNGESTYRLNNLLHEARSMPGISSGGEGWDTNPWLLGCLNGALDLTTGEISCARPNDRLTMTTRVAYDPAAECPLWEQTLGEIFAGQGDDFITYIQRSLGYSLTGDCREESFFFCWGEGRNGKGTIMNTFGEMLGDYTSTLSASALIEASHNSKGAASPEMAKLPRKRFLTVSEFKEGAKLDAERFKAMTGRDPLVARHLYGREFEFNLEAKLWIATNPKPRITDDSKALWARMQFIPFTNSFAGREDRTLKDRLRAEWPGILAWAVRGCLDWQQRGLGVPSSVLAATALYRDESDKLADFYDVCCVLKDTAKVQAGPFYEAYINWSKKVGRYTMGSRKFGEAVSKRFERVHTRDSAWYRGVGLLAKGG